MKRPSLQFYPADWRNNAKLRMCTFRLRGIWLEIMCLMHDSDEYGVLRATLSDIAQAIGCAKKDLKELASRTILKGEDASQVCPAFIYTPRHARKAGEPVILLPEQLGPVWFSSRMVVDEYVRRTAGSATRFGVQTGSPSRPQGDAPSRRLGDGSSSSSSSSPSEVQNQHHGAAIAAPSRSMISAPEGREAFETAWREYPKRAGGNSKKEAMKAWNTRLQNGVTEEAMLAGVRRYAAYVRATGKEKTQYVKQAAVFFGPNEHFTEQWTPPEPRMIARPSESSLPGIPAHAGFRS